MKKRLITSIMVLSLSLLGTVVAYAGGGWSYEQIPIPAYQGYTTVGNQYKWTQDDSAKAISWSEGNDLCFCAMRTGTAIGGRGYIYGIGSPGYSKYNVSVYSIVNTNDVYLRLNTRVSYSSRTFAFFYWSPDMPN